MTESEKSVNMQLKHLEGKSIQSIEVVVNAIQVQFKDGSTLTLRGALDINRQPSIRYCMSSVFEHTGIV